MKAKRKVHKVTRQEFRSNKSFNRATGFWSAVLCESRSANAITATVNEVTCAKCKRLLARKE